MEALKKLAREGKLENKKGIETKKVLCVLLQDNSPGTQSYVQNRSNKIQANVRGFSSDSLIFTILNLRESLQDKEKAAEAIRRYAVNLEVPSEEVTMLKKMSHWPQMYIIEWKLLTYFFYCFHNYTIMYDRFFLNYFFLK